MGHSIIGTLDLVLISHVRRRLSSIKVRSATRTTIKAMGRRHGTLNFLILRLRLVIRVQDARRRTLRSVFRRVLMERRILCDRLYVVRFTQDRRLRNAHGLAYAISTNSTDLGLFWQQRELLHFVLSYGVDRNLLSYLGNLINRLAVTWDLGRVNILTTRDIRRRVLTLTGLIR